MLACANTLKIIDGCGESKGQATRVKSHSRGRLCHNSSKWDSTQGLRQWVLLFRPPRAQPFFRQPSDHGAKNVLSPVTRRQTLGTWVLSRFVFGQNIHLTRSPALITIGIHRLQEP